MKFVTPLILIAIAIAAFFTLVAPVYRGLSDMRTEIASYNEALGNSKALENERDKLAAKFNSFRTEDLSRLEKLLPENADNIRLILEIEQIASPYGMTLKDVRYNTTDTAAVAGNSVVQRTGARQSSKNYGVMELEFATSGTYNNFINFTKDLENNLRIVDVAAISFSSDKGGPSLGKIASQSSYDYSFKIKTYWLKN